MPDFNPSQSRRAFLRRSGQAVAGGALVGGVPVAALGASSAFAADPSAANPIVAENTLTPQSTWTGSFQAKNMTTVMSGYCRQASVDIGQDAELAVSGPNLYLDPSRPTERCRIEVYRLGHYGGKGGRLVWSSNEWFSTWQRLDSFGNPAPNGTERPVSPREDSTGLAGRAGWRTTAKVPGSALSVSGVYLAKLTCEWLEFPPGVPAITRTGEAHIPIIVRDDARPRDLLAVLPSNTWQAYNYWSGRSLYTFSSRYQSYGSIVPATGTERAAKVSLDRPFNIWLAEWNWLLRTEFPAIWWLEQQGYDVSYTEDTALSFDARQMLPDRSRGVVILGHGEYWTQEIRDGLEAARDAGTSVFNFGANTGYWRVRYETAQGRPATSLAEARVLVCYKTIEGGGAVQPNVSSIADPVSPTTTWRDPGKGPNVPVPGSTLATPSVYAAPNRPESTLLGVQYIGDDDLEARPLTVPADNGKGEFAGHRAWRHTTMPSAGKTLGQRLLGWEWDGVPPAGHPFGKPPVTKAGGELKRLTQSDPRINAGGTDLTYVLDAGRSYSDQGAAAQPPSFGTPFAHAVTYTAPSGALVFSSGTIHWSWGLGPHFADTYNQSYADPPTDSSLPEIRQATTNILVDGGIRPATPVGVVVDPPPAPADTTPPKLTGGILNRSSPLFGWYYVEKADRTLRVEVGIGADEQSGPVSVELTLSDAAGTLATQRVSVAPGAKRTVDLVISTTAFSRLSSKLSLQTTLLAVATDAVGNAARSTLTQRLRSR